MNQLALSTDLTVITAEINSFKQVAGQAVFEIGARLKHAKDIDLTHGEWEAWCENSLSMTARQARKYIRVFDRFSNRKLTSVSVERLDMLTAFDDEELEEPVELPSGEIKKPIDMSQKEIEQHKQARRLAEKRADEAEAAQAQALTEHTQQQEALLAQIADLKLVKDSPETLQRIAELEAEIEKQGNKGMENVQLQLEMKRMEQAFNEKISKRDEEIHAMRGLNGAFRNIIATLTTEHANAQMLYKSLVAHKSAHEAVQDFIKHFDPLVQSIFETWREASNLTAEEVNTDDE